MMAATPVPSLVGKNQFQAVNPTLTSTSTAPPPVQSVSPQSSPPPTTSTITYLTLHPSIYLTSNLNRPKLTICDFDPCLNFGQCLPITDRKSFYKFQCVCPEHYSGILCEKYSPPPTLSQLPYSFSSFPSSLPASQQTHSHSSFSPSFHFEQSTFDFGPDFSHTQTQTPVFYQVF